MLFNELTNEQLVNYLSASEEVIMNFINLDKLRNKSSIDGVILEFICEKPWMVQHTFGINNTQQVN